MNANEEIGYGDAIRQGFVYLLETYPEVFCIGQGLWSPWYVGNTMTDLDQLFGRDRIIDTPVSELACTGASIGASLFGYRPVVVHPGVARGDYSINHQPRWRARRSTFSGIALMVCAYSRFAGGYALDRAGCERLADFQRAV